MITPNGIDQERFKDIPMKEPDDEYINVGAVLRVTPIKDDKDYDNGIWLCKK